MQYSLLVFEIVFTTPVISRMVLIKGWVGGGRGVVGASGQVEGGPSCHQTTDSGAVLSADDRDVTQTTGQIETTIGSSLVPNQF